MLLVITVSQIDPNYNIDLVARWISPAFNKINRTLPFAESTYAIFPELAGKISEDMTDAQIKEIVAPAVLSKLKENEGLITEKISYLQAYFHGINDDLLAALAEVHETSWPAHCNRINCYVGYISRCPRNVITKELWVSCTMDDAEIIKASVHELGHFMFYEKWKEIYDLVPKKDLSRPSPRWYLEEMVVEPLLTDGRIRKIVPLGQIAYPQFYSETINGTPIMEYIKGFYENRKSVEDFTKKAHRFVKKNIREIIEKCG